MAITLKQIKAMSLQLINQYSIAGQNIPSSYNNQQDYILRMTALINDAQNYIATTTKKIFAQYVITQTPIPNILSGDTRETKTHLNTDISYHVDSAKAYYFEVSGDATVSIKTKNGTQIIECEQGDTSEFKAYKGLITDTEDVTLIFGGQYPYSFRNVALYNQNFKTENDIPSNALYQEYIMPLNFYQLVGRGIPYTGKNKYCLTHDYEWRGKKTLMLRSDLVGEWKIDYYKYPTAITDSTEDGYILDVYEEAVWCIPYYVAAHLVMQDDANAAYTLLNEWELKMSRLNESIQTDVNIIEDVYGFFGGGE